MKRPIVWANIFLTLGILLGQSDTCRTVVFLFAAAGLCACLYMKYKYWPVFLFLLFSLAGAARVRDSLKNPLDGQPLYARELTGTVIENGTTASGRIKLIVELSPSRLPDDIDRVMVYTESEAEVGRGVKFSGLLLPPERASAPGEYDEFVYFATKKIDAKIFTGNIELLEASEENLYIRLLTALRQTRDTLAAVYDAALPPREAGTIKSLLLGDKSGLEEDSVRLYRAAGIYHLLCISGLHVGIFMLAIGRVFGFVLNERYAWLAGLAVLILYAILTGASVSTVRAVTMCGVIVFSKLLFRDSDLLASVSFACIALLIYEPLYLYEAGFQLSFAAVFGIATLTAPIERGISLTVFRKMPFKNSLAVCVAATLSTGPILMYHFSEVSFYGVLVNLFVIPTSTVLVVFGLLTGLLGLLGQTAALFLAGVPFYLLKFYDAVIQFFGALPFAVIETGQVSVPMCALMYAALVCFAAGMARFRDEKR